MSRPAASAAKGLRLGSTTFALVAVVAAAAAAIALAYTKHESRKSFIELQRLSEARDALNIEYGRLQLEQSSYAAHGLIETKADDVLSLKRPSAEEVFLIGDDGDYRFVGLEPAGTGTAQATPGETP